MTRWRVPASVAFFAVVGLLVQRAAVAVPFTSSYADGGVWNTVFAQGFSPSESVSPDPGVGLNDTVALDRFDFFKSGNADAAANIQLAIVSNIFLNLDTLTTSSPELVGLSSNTIASTAAIATGSPVTFHFDSLELTYGENYAAIVVNNNAGDLNLVLVSALTANYTENPTGSGIYLPTTNYGDPDPDFPGNYFLATSNFTHTDAFGTYFDTFGGQGDAVFTAYFNQEAGLAGDFNGDSQVDAADYVTWRKSDGSPDGYNTWRANFGMSAGGGGAGDLGSATAIPEPGALVASCILAAMVWLNARARGLAFDGSRG